MRERQYERDRDDGGQRWFGVTADGHTERSGSRGWVLRVGYNHNQYGEAHRSSVTCERQRRAIVRDARTEAANGETYEMAADHVLGTCGKVEWSRKHDEGTGAERRDDDSLLQTEKQQDKECGEAGDCALANICSPVRTKTLPPGSYAVEADAVLPQSGQRRRGD